MATIWCCGAECGVSGIAAPHISAFLGTASFSTTTFRSGFRAIRTNPTAGQGSFGNNQGEVSGTLGVGRSYFNAASPPSTKDTVIGFNTAANRICGLAYDPADSKWYPGEDDGTTCTIGSQGVSLSAGWHLLDVRVNVASNPWLIDVSIDGVALTQLSRALTASTVAQWRCGNPNRVSNTYDIYHDDFLLSLTSGDYPLGPGYILSYIPNADGTHNVAGANDFERSGTGTDITNATTDAFDLINDRPLPTTSVDYINGIAPPNATDYVEWQYEDSTELVHPRSVEGVVAWHSSGTGTNGWTVTLREHGGGTSATMASGTVGQTTIGYTRTHHATVPGTANAWTIPLFNALRSRFLVSDAAPDPFIDAAMLEVEYPNPPTRKPVIISQARPRAAVR